jgi:hypothetical protein
MLPIKLWQIKKKAALAVFIPVAVLMTGCDRDALFEQVQRFSGSAEQLKSKFPLVATDVYDSCLRTAEYTAIQISDRPFQARNSFRASCMTPLEFKGDRGQLVSVTREEFEDELITVNNVVVNYLQALGTVASGGEISYTENVQALGTAIGRVEPRLNKTETQASQSILDFLLGAFNGEFRQETLATEVTATNEPLQIFICRLKQDLVGQYLDAELQTEQEAVDEYYQAYINRELQIDKARQEQEYLIQQYLRQELQLKRLGERILATKPPLTVFELDSNWKEARAEVRQREATAKGYIDILNTIAAGHSQLDKQLGGSGKGQTELCPNEANGSLAYNDLPQVFPGETKESDLTQIATKYANRLESQLAQLNSTN